MSQHTIVYESPLGPLTLVSDAESLTNLWFEERKPLFGKRLDPYVVRGPVPVLDKARHWLDDYFAGRKPSEPPAMTLEGTPFKQAVWRRLQLIPYGEVTTYAVIAASLTGWRPSHARPVGRAAGQNPISIIIPCHRVIGYDGSLTGYGAGIDFKKWLLSHEGFKLP